MAERKGGDANGRWWRAGASRVGLESADVTEQRRRQRIDAAARMLNHVVALVVWIGVTIAVFHLFEIDAAFFLSSAGFIGAGVRDRRPAQGQRLPHRPVGPVRGPLRRR